MLISCGVQDVMLRVSAQVFTGSIKEERIPFGRRCRLCCCVGECRVHHARSRRRRTHDHRHAFTELRRRLQGAREVSLTSQCRSPTNRCWSVDTAILQGLHHNQSTQSSCHNSMSLPCASNGAA